MKWKDGEKEFQVKVKFKLQVLVSNVCIVITLECNLKLHVITIHAKPWVMDQ